LLPRLDTSLRRLSWDHRVRSHRRFPCEHYWATIPSQVVTPFLIGLAQSRMRIKAGRIADRVSAACDFDQILFEEVFRALGFMPNAEPMVLLARRVPLSLARRLNSVFDLTCLLLGASGLLPRVSEFVTGDRSAIAYSVRIRERYLELNRDLHVTPLPRQTWRLSRMRPGNSPTLRIAQAAALFGNGGPLAGDSSISVVSAVEQADTKFILDALLGAEPDAYWQRHSSLTKSRRRPRSAAIGVERRTTIVVNAFLPLVSFVSEYDDRPQLETSVLHCLNGLRAQADKVTRPYLKLRERPTSAAIAQGIHELSRSWCTKERCLECPVGRHLSRSGCRFTG